ncbi:MAG TPA: alpha/beta fold hydrolase [Candidatus Dormibacteraeota bacterium]|nr:alpha/beta fold hydrolase [Candidatus Dormibacteraeota bacterium]
MTPSPAVVIGRSLGGEIALDLAVRHPQHVRALVLLDPAVLGWSQTQVQSRAHQSLHRTQGGSGLIAGDNSHAVGIPYK